MSEHLDVKILKTLLNADKPLSSEAISFECSKSSKTVRMHLKELSELLQTNGAKIEMKKGYGYSLEVIDELNFKAFMNNYYFNESEMQNDDALLNELTTLFISQEDYLKVDDLCEALFISKSKLTQLLNQLRLTLKYYDLTLESKPYYGLKIIGEEFNYRRFISSIFAQNYTLSGYSFLLNNPNRNYREMIERITEIVSTALDNNDYPMPSYVFDSFIAHLTITILRLKKNMFIDLSTDMILKEVSQKELNLVHEIKEEIEEIFDVKLPQSELEYMMLHLVSKRVLEITDKQNIPMEVNKLINQMLERIKETKNIDLLDDLDLRIMLGLHIVPLISRIKYGIELKNPLLEEVKWRCIAAYDLAITACRVIEETYKVQLSEHEISYFTLHLDVALNKSTDKIKKKNILIVCGSGRASARLLQVKFQQLFENYLEIIDVCDVNEIHLWTESRTYDFIFTTVPLKQTLPMPVFEFSFFLNTQSIKEIQSVLSGKNKKDRISQYFRKELFFSNVEVENRDEALQTMFKKIREVRDLPDNFEAMVLEREAYCGTDLMPNTALPHPNQTVTEDTFISVMTLKKPILWNQNKVRLILLISISRNDSEHYRFLFEIILSLLSSASAIQRLLNEGSYEALKQELIDLDIEKAQG